MQNETLRLESSHLQDQKSENVEEMKAKYEEALKKASVAHEAEVRALKIRQNERTRKLISQNNNAIKRKVKNNHKCKCVYVRFKKLK